jgi:hypothetical protein
MECWKDKKRNSFILFDYIMKSIPYREFEGIIELQYCLSDYGFAEHVTSSLNQDVMRFNERALVTTDTDKKNIKFLSYSIDDEFYKETHFKKETYLLNILSNLESKSYLRYIIDLSLQDEILRLFVTMNVFDTIKVEMVTKLNYLIFEIKNSQNKTEYFVKQLLVEISYLMSLIVNYFYFIISSISVMGIWLFREIYSISRYTRKILD